MPLSSVAFTFIISAKGDYMKKAIVVKRKEEFNKIIKTGSCFKNKDFVIYYLPNNLGYDKFGISVGKKIGKAVIRNKYKRKIRSMIDEYKKVYQNSRNYIIILRKNCLELSHEEIKKSFFNLMTKQKGAKDEK